MDDADVAPRARRGLGFFPEAVVIRSRSSAPAPARTWDAESASAGITAPVPVAAREPWHALKQWHMNPSGHGGRSAPPVFVPAENTYDELGRSVADGYAVEVDAEAEDDDHDEADGKLSGGDVASWYRSLASSSATSRAATPAEAEAKSAGTATNSTASRPPRSGRLKAEPSRSGSASPAPTSSDTASGPTAPEPVRVHRSEWFIRRALLSSSKTTPSAPTPPPRPSSIGGMLNIAAAKPAPAPIPRYALGRDNAGYARLESLGWQGGGLGRPAGWTGDQGGVGVGRAASAERSISEPPDGVVDLTRSSDEEGDDDDDEIRHGPGRTAPIATALKLDRLGLGRTQPHKRVTHTSAEIARAQRRARGGKGAPTKSTGEPSKKAKVKWAERDRRDREQRARIAASLQ